MKKIVAHIFVTSMLFITLYVVQPTAAQITDSSKKNQIHIVIAGDSLSQIAQDYRVSLSQLVDLNQLESTLIYVGQTLKIPEANSRYQFLAHIVASGDTLGEIAQKYDVSTTELLAHNDIYNPNTLSIGQIIIVPTSHAFVVEESIADILEKRIIVDLSEQATYLYENNELIKRFVVSTGEPGRETATGVFAIQNKIPTAYASTWNLAMPSWLGIYWAGDLQNGFHALPILPDGSLLWDGYLGTPISYGCVVLSHSDAKILYDWAEIGTKVVIQD